MIGAEKRANSSGDSFAKVFGEISPKISTTTVVTMVEREGPVSSPAQRINNTVATDADAILTMLLPMRMVDSNLSYWSESRSTKAARLSPFSARLLTRMRLREEKAVYVEEKNADIIRQTIMIMIPTDVFMMCSFRKCFLSLVAIGAIPKKLQSVGTVIGPQDQGQT